MKQRITVLSLLAALAVVACVTGTAIAQEDTIPAHPMYERLRPTLHADTGNAPTANAALPMSVWPHSSIHWRIGLPISAIV